jgi:hypothetical protein
MSVMRTESGGKYEDERKLAGAVKVAEEFDARRVHEVAPTLSSFSERWTSG